MEVKDSVTLVTGANRGISHAFVRALIDHGAAKVYAGARDPATVANQDVIPLQLDVTSPAQITTAAALADDVTTMQALAGNSVEVLTDERTREVKAALSRPGNGQP